MLALLLIIGAVQMASCSCPSGFDLVHAGECRGFLESLSLDHDEAYERTVQECAAIQALPVIIHIEEQQIYWLKQQQQHGNVILGLTCNTANMQWTWADGSAMDYLPPGDNDEDLLHACISGCSVYLKSDGNWHVGCDKNSESVSVFCTAQLPPLPTPSPDGCLTFEDDSDDGVCFEVSEASNNWQDAQAACRSMGAYLASIHNAQENSFIRRLAVSKGAVNFVFLGGVIPANGHNFMWTDGTKWDYDNLYADGPLSGNGECLAMDTGDISGKWMNTNCASALPAACARPQGFSPPTCTTGTLKEGDVIYSPGFPFDASVPCDYTLLVKAGKKVQVEVIFLEANSCCDFLYLYDDNDKIIATYTGEMQGKISPTSSSNLMKVSWKPNGAVNVRGVMLTFKGV